MGIQYWESKGGYDEGVPRQCPSCGNYFHEDGLLTEVDGYRECFDCLVDDPEIKTEIRISNPELFIGFFVAHYYAEKAKQIAAYLTGDEAKDPEHPEHRTVVYRALERAKVIVQACEAQLEFENEVSDEKASRDFDAKNDPLRDQYGNVIVYASDCQ